MPNLNKFRGVGIVLSLALALLFVSGVGEAQTDKSKQTLAARINYNQVPLKMVIKSLADQLKLNVVFDESFKDYPKYDIELKDVTLESALKVIFVEKKLAAKRIEEKTIIVFADNPTVRARLEAYPDWPEKK